MLKANALKKIGALLMAALFLCLCPALFGRGAAPVSASPEGTVSMQCSEADRIIVERARRLAFLGSPDMTNTWTPRYSFLACNSDKRYEAGVPENSMPYSRSALFNSTQFEGLQQYIGWIDPDSGATPGQAYSLNNFLSVANTAGSVFDLASREALIQNVNWGAIMGSDCSAFLSYAWQIPHMTTYMFTSDAVDWNICRIVPATKGHEGAYTMDDLKALQPGDALICCRTSDNDEHGNPIYRGHCVLITDIRLDKDGVPAIVDTLEEISPRAIAKTRSAKEFLEYANRKTSSDSYYKCYRLISKSHLKLEIEITYDTNGGEPFDAENSVAFAFVRSADGSGAEYGDLLSPVPEKEGAVFLGWALTPYSQNVLLPGDRITEEHDHKLYAIWSEADN